MIRVLVDENIPVPDCFRVSGLELQAFSGRHICAADLVGVDALLVRSVTRVNADLLLGSGVSFVASATAGRDHLDTDFLQQSGIDCYVAAGSNANSVVDYVLGCLAALGVDPREKEVGIVGCGQVGGRLYRRMKLLGANCHCYDPFLLPSQQKDLCELDQVLASQLVCLHTPLTTDGPFPTSNMLDYDQLIQLPAGAVLINAGRGGVINESGLQQVFKERPDIRLVMDVWSNEPDIDLNILALAEIATPHIAGYAAQAKLRGSHMVFSALFNHFEMPLPDGANKAPESGGRLDKGLSWDVALLSVYDPRVDDLRLREMPDSEGFDRMRKGYPLRAELSEFYTDNQQLEAFGFSPARAPIASG